MRFSTIDSLDADLAAADFTAAMNGPGSPTPYIKEEVDDGPFTPRFLAHPGLDPQHPLCSQCDKYLASAKPMPLHLSPSSRFPSSLSTLVNSAFFVIV